MLRTSKKLEHIYDCEAIPSSFNVLVNVQDAKEQKWLEALFFGTLAACPGIFVVLVLF